MLLESEDAMSGHRLLWKLVMLLGALGNCAAPGFAQEGTFTEVKWRLDYNIARKEALERKLPIVIDFVTKTCFHCNRMDATTFRDPRIVSLMNERFIPLKMDGDVEVNL